MENKYLYFINGWASYQEGGIPPENYIELNEKQSLEIKKALFEEKKIIQDGSSYLIIEKEPLPDPEPLTPEEKLQQAGLTIEELKTLLGLPV